MSWSSNPKLIDPWSSFPLKVVAGIDWPKNSFRSLPSSLRVVLGSSVVKRVQPRPKENESYESNGKLSSADVDDQESPGLTLLVDALLRNRLFNVHVCAPQSDKSVSGHSLTVKETLAATSVELSGATAYADCVSLALSGALFSWSKPILVISGINKGSSCGQKMFYSGAFAGAREALISGVSSLCILLNWKKDVNCETDLKDATNVCLPLIYAAVKDIEKGNFPKGCLLNVDIPSCPLTNKLVMRAISRLLSSMKSVKSWRFPKGNSFSEGVWSRDFCYFASLSFESHLYGYEDVRFQVKNDLWIYGFMNFVYMYRVIFCL
ncbi:hypothetical protein EZV62_009355 [Acer yangbiense]|uniref:Survival protein SurE-like phosphatase/nucleotidase domain-containing protein n=1 Tax=Acer yangbiense TaxID=1000413 RepID=A0A5C7IFF9_9ROSI|nr:hypothetical protein EZV62_009355 [Acer yangbiense]